MSPQSLSINPRNVIFNPNLSKEKESGDCTSCCIANNIHYACPCTQHHMDIIRPVRSISQRGGGGEGGGVGGGGGGRGGGLRGLSMQAMGANS